MLSEHALKKDIMSHLFSVIDIILKEINPSLLSEETRILDKYKSIDSSLTSKSDTVFFKNHFKMLSQELQYQTVYAFMSGINELKKNGKIEYTSYNNLLMVSGLTFININPDFMKISRQYVYNDTDKNFDLYNEFTKMHKSYNILFATEAFKHTEYIVNRLCRLFQ